MPAYVSVDIWYKCCVSSMSDLVVEPLKPVTSEALASKCVNVFVLLEFVNNYTGHIIFNLPGLSVHRLLHDVCHSQLLGTGKTLNGTFPAYICLGWLCMGSLRSFCLASLIT